MNASLSDSFGGLAHTEYNTHGKSSDFARVGFVTRNLVDPASSHMLVSRTKPCKSQSKWITVGLQTAH